MTDKPDQEEPTPTWAIRVEHGKECIEVERFAPDLAGAWEIMRRELVERGWLRENHDGR